MAQEPAEEANGLREARGSLIRAERARQKLTQHELAELAGISRTHLANIELGRRDLTEDSLRGIAQALGVKEAKLRNPLAELWVRAS